MKGITMVAYLYLTIAIICEVIATSLLLPSQNFTKPIPTIIMFICYGIAFYCLTHTIKAVPVAIVYASWSGLGIVAITFIGYIFFKQILTWQAIIGMVFIIIGVILVNFYAKH